MKINICHNKTKQNKHNNILKKPSILKLQNSKYRSGLNCKREKTMIKKNGKTKTKKKKQKQKQLRIEKGVSPLMMWSRDDVHLFPEKNLVVCCKTICTKRRDARKVTKAQISEPYIYEQFVLRIKLVLSTIVMRATMNYATKLQTL